MNKSERSIISLTIQDIESVRNSYLIPVMAKTDLDIIIDNLKLMLKGGEE